MKRIHWPQSHLKSCPPASKGEGQHGVVYHGLAEGKNGAEAHGVAEGEARGHLPVLLNEVIEELALKPNGIYIDATFGCGGHAQAILQRLGNDGQLFVVDKDPDAIASASLINDKRLNVKLGSFAQLFIWINEFGLVGKIDGILLDLGVSSPQLDNRDRGFSFMRDGPLDMRMDTTQDLTAAKWINKAGADVIAKVLREYGQERFAKRIASAIVEARKVEAIETTMQLVKIIELAKPYKEVGKHAATRAFQAIRIFINNELDDLNECLIQCAKILKVGGKLLVISFHSLETRLVRKFIRDQIPGSKIPSSIPIRSMTQNPSMKLIKKVVPSDFEVKNNPRARSATLQVMEKIL